MYPPLGQVAALEVEVGRQDMNTSVMARLEVEAHPLPYFSDVIWTIVSPGGEKQVSASKSSYVL